MRPSIRVLMLSAVSIAALEQSSTPAPPGKLINLGSRRLHLSCADAGSPTVLVETGAGSFSVEWKLVQDLVAKDTHVCVYDRAGYAWSDHGPMGEGIEQMIDDLHLLLRRAPIPTPVIMVCQSLGCIYARAYQRRHPEQVVGFVFLDGTHDEGITLVLGGERRPISTLTREQLPQAYEEYRRSLPALKPGVAGSPPFDRLPHNLQTTRQWAFEKMVREMGWLPNTLAAAKSWREEFTTLRQLRLASPHPLGSLPLIVIERTKDTNPAWHAQQLQLSQLSSSGKLIEAEASGHMIHLERPDLVGTAIRQMLDELRGTT